MGKRVESPSSLNTFLQCQRKYYYQYIENLPTKESIHTIRGTIAHAVLEKFYSLDVLSFSPEDYARQFSTAVQEIFLQEWEARAEELFALQVPSEELQRYFEDTLFMLLNWCTHFTQEFSRMFTGNILETFQRMKPVTEVEYVSEELSVHGFIDALHRKGDEVQLIDYKTNTTPEIKESMRLQLGIYALLYREKHGKAPQHVGIFFLRDRLYLFPVEEELLEYARKVLLMVHAHTSVTEDKEGYEKTVGPLCKWKTGQCDFYETCKPFEKL